MRAENSWAMRLMVQRRLGLPLTAQVPEGERSRHGRAFDVMGDLATNDGKSGHQSRHHSVLVELVTRLRSSWGSAVEYEPAGYKGYSDTRPDLTVDTRDGRKIGDVKIKDPIGSDPTDVGRRGAYVDFGNTAPSSHDQVQGRAERGRKGEAFRPSTGAGRVEPVKGDYARAKRNGCEVYTLLFETFGGMSPGVVKLVREAAEDRGNRLHGAEFDATTWSARTWTSFTMQRISCALMVAVAWELAGAMGLASVGDTRDDDE